MSDKQLDRRVRRTRRALQDSLTSLILEKGYDAVTVEDITDRADLGRTTFYLHYKDKEELLIPDSFIQTNPVRPSARVSARGKPACKCRDARQTNG